jgi:hypothetical protein
MLAADGDTRALEEIIDEDWKTELAQRLLFRDRALFDVAPALGCHCAGARPGVSPSAARPSVVALEPPRASSDVIDPNVAVDVDRTLPVFPTRVRDVAPAAIVTTPPPDEPRPDAASTSAPPPPPPPPPAPPPAAPVTTDSIAVAEEEARRRKAAAPVVARAAQTVPLARTEGGQVLPRAYAARRRTPADGGAAIAPAESTSAELVPTSPLAETPSPDPAVETGVVEMATAMRADEVAPAAEVMAAEPPTAAVVEAVAQQPAVVEERTVEQVAPAPDQTSPSPRATPRSVVVPIPAEELRPVPPPPPADHARAAIVTAVVTVAVALVAFAALQRDDGRVTSESSGIAAAATAPAVLDSLPPLAFPLPDTGAMPQRLSADTTTRVTPPPDTAPKQEPQRIAAATPSTSVRSAPTRARRPLPPIRLSRADSISRARAASRRVADSLEREAIRNELEHRRARLDSIERSLGPGLGRPDR